jgi:protein-disulfide isomerase/peroxiredoxin
MTASGWSYFEPPLDEPREFWAGNPDATVTVVEYADFQCAYCRRLSNELDTIKENYGDRIRVLMKHFPMHESCNPQARGYDKHPLACDLAYAAHCSGLQGKFWEMHDLLFDNQPSLSSTSATEFASQLGLDLPSFETCVQSPETRAKIEADVGSGRYAGFNGTPRLYINNHLLSGSRSRKIIEYYIEKALERGSEGLEEPAAVAQSPKPAGGVMVAAQTSAGTFYIDPYEGAIDVDGRAVSKPGVPPTYADYFMAETACEKAGKRICTEEEWLSACTGVSAVDNNGNGLISDDALEGNLYPYGPFYRERACNDDADPLSGTPDDTGSWEQCRTASGIYDMTGNIGEWVLGDHGEPLSVGGAMSTRNAECSRRYKSKPAHTRNRSTGFRCCADSPIESDVDVELAENEESVLLQPAPVIQANDKDGNPVKIDDFTGRVTLINFFASWCAPCRREFPHLVDYVDEYESRGLRIVGVGVDTNAASAIRFAEQFNANFLVLTDPENRVKGDYLVYTMPATFLVDRDGIIRHQFVGFTGADQEAEFRRVIEEML